MEAMTRVRPQAAAFTLVVALGAGSAFVGAAPALARIPVGPDQRFSGVVNDQLGSAPVYVACPGPIWPGRTTHPLGNQTLEVLLDSDGDGFTGPAANRIVARFSDDPSVGVRFARYAVEKPIPTSLEVPCEGTGTVVFRPRPASATSRADVVKVTWVNLAV
jgi:hypothetical protein